MKKPVLCIFLLLLAAPFLPAQSPSALDELIDFTITIKDLSDSSPERKEAILNSGQFVVIEGSVTAIEVQEGETPVIIIDLVNGEWLQSGEIGVYRCRVYLDAKTWAFLLPADPKNPGEADLILHKHLLVIGSVTKFTSQGKNSFAVIDGHQVRIIP